MRTRRIVVYKWHSYSVMTYENILVGLNLDVANGFNFDCNTSFSVKHLRKQINFYGKDQ
jgi:hypothetical protein